MNSESYCGCCGREMRSGREWCADCSAHVEHGTLPPWRRTYEAQHGTACPYQNAVRPVNSTQLINPTQLAGTAA